MAEEEYERARHIPEIQACLGRRLVDVTETDADERARGEPDVLTLHFDNGIVLAFGITPGFNISTPGTCGE